MSVAIPWRRGLLLFLVALLTAGSVGGTRANACSCAASGSPSEMAQKDLREADAVFVGEAVEVDGFSDPSSERFGAASFGVETLWKGDPSEEVVVHRPGGAASSCGVAFREGERYLVYAYRSVQGEGDRLKTGVCDSTQPLRGITVDLGALGPPLQGLPETGGPLPPPAASRDGAALLLLAPLGIGALYLRGRRSRNLR